MKPTPLWRLRAQSRIRRALRWVISLVGGAALLACSGPLVPSFLRDPPGPIDCVSSCAGSCVGAACEPVTDSENQHSFGVKHAAADAGGASPRSP